MEIMQVEAGANLKSVTLILLVETGTHHLIKMHLRLGCIEFGLLYEVELEAEFHSHAMPHTPCFS